MTEQELSYLIKVNDRDLTELKKRVKETNTALGSGTEKAGGKAGRALRGMAGFARSGAVVLAGFGIAAKKSVDAASDLNEQQNKAQVVFGKSSDSILAWSKTTATSIGLSSRAALEGAGTFGNMLVPMGIAPGKAANMSKSMVNLAGDLASFNNASPEETLDALRSGLAGETEPLRRFGVFLNQSRIEQEAARLGLVKHGQELTNTAKAQAIYSIITKDTTAAQGDFARTSSSAANQQRIMAAQTENLEAGLGQGLLPVYQAALGVLTRFVGIAQRHTTATKVAAAAIGVLAAAALACKAALAVQNSGLVRLITSERVAAAAAKAYSIAQWLVNAALTANPIGLVIVGLAALAAAFVIAYKKSSTFRSIVNGALQAVKIYIAPLRLEFELLVGVFRTLVSWAGTLADKLGSVGGALDKAKGAADFITSAGGLFSAHGGYGPASGPRIVGERGYEIISDNGLVTPHAASRRLAGGGGPLVHVENLIVRDRLDVELVAGSLARKLALR